MPSCGSITSDAPAHKTRSIALLYEKRYVDSAIVKNKSPAVQASVVNSIVERL